MTIPVNQERHLENLLSGATWSPQRRLYTLRLLEAHLPELLPACLGIACTGDTPVNERATGLALDLLEQRADLETAALVYDHLPARSNVLVKVAIISIQRILNAFLDHPKKDLNEVALLIAFSEWLDLDGQSELALQAATLAVDFARNLVSEDSQHVPNLIRCLCTLSKRHATQKSAELALEYATEAVSYSKEHCGPRALLTAQAELCRANRFKESGRLEETLRSGKAACRILQTLKRKGAEVTPDLALANLICANALNDLTRYREAEPFAQEAHELYWSLSSDKPDHYLEYHLAAANALSISLSMQDRPDEAAELAARGIEFLKGLAKAQRRRFGREFAVYLLSYSAARLEHGDLAEARRAGEMALSATRLLARVTGMKDHELEGSVQNNLFNVAYSEGEYERARRHAQSARKAFQAHSNPQDSVQLAQATRNLAEAQRMLAKTGRALARATATANEAIDLLNGASATVDIAPHKARTYSTLARCYEDSGRLAESLVAEKASLILRRALAEQHPTIYQSDVAFSLVSLGRLYQRLGERDEALAVLQEAVQVYISCSPKDPNQVRQLTETIRLLGTTVPVHCGITVLKATHSQD